VAADEAGYPVIVADSWSHEWSGVGGCCEQQEAELDRMAGDNWQKREACRLASWIRPKVAHRKLISRLLQLRAHVIFALRAEPKVEMQRGPDGKMQVLPKRLLGWSSEWIPVTEKSFMFEMTASFVLSPDRPGIPIPIKLQEQHRPFFPLDQPISETSGQRLAEWAKGSTVSPTPIEADIADLIRRLGEAADVKAGQSIWSLASKQEFWEQLSPSQKTRLTVAKDAMKARLKAA
jgi:hypothetical protein